MIAADHVGACPRYAAAPIRPRRLGVVVGWAAAEEAQTALGSEESRGARDSLALPTIRIQPRHGCGGAMSLPHGEIA